MPGDHPRLYPSPGRPGPQQEGAGGPPLSCCQATPDPLLLKRAELQHIIFIWSKRPNAESYYLISITYANSDMYVTHANSFFKEPES